MSKRDEVREQLAQLGHERWCRELQDILGLVYIVRDASGCDHASLPTPSVAKWRKLAHTPWSELGTEAKHVEVQHAERVLAIMDQNAYSIKRCVTKGCTAVRGHEGDCNVPRQDAEDKRSPEQGSLAEKCKRLADAITADPSPHTSYRVHKRLRHLAWLVSELAAAQSRRLI